MSNAKKDLFLKVLKETKLPYGYPSIIGRKTLPNNVAVPLTRLGNFFHGKLKSYVRNRSNLEGSIAEGYMMEECLTFIYRYLREGVNTRLDRRCARNFSLNQHDDKLSLFPKVGHPIGGKRKRKGKGFTLDFQCLNKLTDILSSIVTMKQLKHTSRAGGEVRDVNIADISNSKDVNDLEDDVDYDNTDWDWIDATEDIPAHEP
uniref:DUF4218 domain-containing protein n=1 Tax=Chenopodium quinoa TaxID=63459 RepID=A0A803MMF2_CHEQI